MKPREINEGRNGTVIVPDSIAEWDAPSHWERERLASMEAVLQPGWKLFDVGTEHGWLTAVYGGYVGHENVVLFEPSGELWVNIRRTWESNGFPDPLACWEGFVAEESSGELPPSRYTKAGNLRKMDVWPASADSSKPEVGAMAYRSLVDPGEIPAVSIDDFVTATDIVPDAITIDVEGAELGVLRGARRTLLEHRPHVWVSVHPDLIVRDFGATDEASAVEEIFSFVQGECGYGREYLGTDHEQHHWFAPIEWRAP